MTCCVLKDPTLPFFPNKGDKKYTKTRFIPKLKKKEDIKVRIIYLDFETCLEGQHHVNLSRIEPPLHTLLLPNALSHIDPYKPYPFVEHEFDPEFEYVQTVNHCECQSKNSKVCVFKDLHDTLVWLGEKEQAESIAVEVVLTYNSCSVIN